MAFTGCILPMSQKAKNMGPGLTVMRGSCICVVLLLPDRLMRSNTGLTAEPRASRMLSDDSKAICKMPPSPWFPELHSKQSDSSVEGCGEHRLASSS